jgi:hypothetical protein
MVTGVKDHCVTTVIRCMDKGGKSAAAAAAVTVTYLLGDGNFVKLQTDLDQIQTLSSLLTALRELPAAATLPAWLKV